MTDGSREVPAGADGEQAPGPHFRRLFESAPDAYLVLDPDLRILAASDAYLAATRTRRDTIVGQYLFDVFPDNPDDPNASGVANTQASMDRVRRDLCPDTMPVQQHDICPVDGGSGPFETRYWSPRNSPVLGPEGQLVYIIHRVEDVTEFVRLHDVGTEQQQLTSMLQQRTTQMEAEILRRSAELADANRRLGEAAVREATARHEAQVERERRQALAEREQLEAQLGQSQRLESLGQLAGGVAHDFNNLLAVILNYSAFVEEELAAAIAGPDADAERWELAHADVEQIRRAAERATALTHQLLAFGRREIVRPRVVDLNDIVVDIENLLRRTLGEHVQLHTALAPRLCPVLADPGQIEQVLVNLAVNARDAMPAGGTLTIDTANVAVDDDYAAQHVGVQPGPHVLLRVSDSGTGMPRDVIDRAFDPFFTTKPKGAGTGLGLATVYGIINQAGGSTRIYSEPGLGTTITALLPVTTAVPEPARPVVAPARRPPGRQTVLVVEDEEAIREVTRRILTRNGYEVLTAATGAAAVELAERTDRDIHLLLTDVIMPAMLGREVAERVRAHRPHVQVLFMSGYAHPVLTSQGILDPGVVLVDKPFSEAGLITRIQEQFEPPP
ncbi:MAG TPA: ATP-binding protein [Mycobacteriales bacterium]|nr:ATP-binding protein [Mycobacteriales bacterium]